LSKSDSHIIGTLYEWFLKCWFQRILCVGQRCCIICDAGRLQLGLQSSDRLILFTLLRSADTNTKIFGLYTESNRHLLQIGIFSMRLAYLRQILFKLKNNIESQFIVYMYVYGCVGVLYTIFAWNHWLFLIYKTYIIRPGK